MSENEEEEEIDYDNLEIDPNLVCKVDIIYTFNSYEYEQYGFDLKLLKTDNLYANLIHFDLNMTNPENYKYYNNFKLDVVGEFFAIDDLKILKKFLEEKKGKMIPFIVLSSGSSGKDVIKICKNYSFVKEVIIFCGNYEYNKHYIKKYKGYVKKVLTSIKEVYKYIKSFDLKVRKNFEKFNELDSFIFSCDDVKMKRQLEQNTVISALEYDNCYFLIHRACAHYFGNMDDKRYTHFKLHELAYYLNSCFTNISDSNRKDFISRLELLEKKENFAELAIREYTRGSGFYYFFSREMKKFKEELYSLSYFMGPFLFCVNKYVNEHHEKFGFNEDMTLYRNIQCTIYDFFFYKINLNHIICFPSLTSTSTVKGEFIPIDQNKNLMKIGINYEDLINVTMIFIYKHNSKNKSPGIIVKDNKASDGEYMSVNPNENEVILFPFTFARITKINKVSEKIYEIYLEIINREVYIEYILRDSVDKRIKFSSFD